MKSIPACVTGWLALCGVAGVAADHTELSGRSDSQAQAAWPTGNAATDGSDTAPVEGPAYDSSEGVFKHPLPQAELRYDSKQGVFIRPDSNTPSGFNPRDPTRGYRAPESGSAARVQP